jgi:membrane-bound lytic murein transglycosylase B
LTFPATYLSRHFYFRQGGALMLWHRLAIVFILLLFYPAAVKAAEWAPLIGRLAADGFDRQRISRLFDRPEVRFEPDSMSKKIESLIKKKDRRSIATCPRCREIYQSFLKPDVINEARAYAKENKEILDRIASDYCVPGEVVVAILVVETKLGKNLGDKNAFNTLASMALTSDLELIRPYLDGNLITPQTEEYARSRCRQKSNWAYNELKSLIRYADLNGVDPLLIPGSIYGAIGLCQFMPSNVSIYGIDGDRDGRIDLFTAPDALPSVGNYLKKSGWTCSSSKKRQYQAVFAYNHSRLYTETVLAVAGRIKNGRSVAMSR